MNNKMPMSRRERVRLSKNEKKISEAIALPIALFLMIVFHLSRIAFKTLFKTKRYLGRVAIVCFMIYNAYNALSLAAYAPKSAYALNGIKPPVITITPYQFDTLGEIKKIWKEDWKIGYAISSCESGANPNRYHINDDGSIDFSVFQVNTVHGVILDPIENITYAYKLYKEQGLQPWASSAHCWKEKI